MNIVLFRIDERLIHGQVIQGWRRLEYHHIIIFNDRIADNEMEKQLQVIGVPEGITVTFARRDELSKVIKKENISSKNILFLVESPADALYAIKNGVKVDKVNIGILTKKSPRIHQINNAVFVSDEEMDILKEISDMGIIVEAQGVPTDEPVVLF
jgi:mannose/fructose/N-acetylgalactosamine-specific phosphotransferase system component IIB